MKHRLFLTLISLLLFIGAGQVMAQDDTYAGSPEAAAPNFPENLDWINVDGSLTLEDLRGKVVLLDFWTYGCINCLHMIPTLHRLETKYENELVVIGVHSAKFENEGQTDNIREIVQRYEIKHPVINDHDFEVWGAYRRFGVNAWPTFVLIDPRGNVYASQAGEIPFEAFDNVIGNMITYFDTQDELNREPLAMLAPELDAAPPRVLNYPGKVLADPEGNRLFIADSVNHRLIVTTLDTFEVLDVIGNGVQGYVDGDYETAQFYKPQGMALKDNMLYVADTFNHVIRAVDLDEKIVDTIAGTGTQGISIPRASGFPAQTIDLRSPWDVTFGEGNTMFVAMAGTHQIWELDVDTRVMRFSVGNGREAQYNDTLLQSELAQPSGLYFEDGLLYFADSESSTIRLANYNTDEVRVVSGTTDNNLFDYGDIDGPPGVSRLQHALGVVGDGNGNIYVADTYNSKIKLISGEDGITTTLFGGDNPGFADGDMDTALFNEPGGLSYSDGKLYVADTNNHAIRVIDLESKTVSTVMFPNPERLRINGRATVIAGNEFTGAETLDEQTVTAGDGEIVLTLNLPEGYKINDLAPSLAEFGSRGSAVVLEANEFTIVETELRVPVELTEGSDLLQGAFDVYYCEAINETLCFIERFAVEIPIEVTADSDTSTIQISREVFPPVQAGSINNLADES